MKNIFGDEREPQPLQIKVEGKTLCLSRGGSFVGIVFANGTLGGVQMIDHELGEPIVNQIFGGLSLSEMQRIIDAWKANE